VQLLPLPWSGWQLLSEVRQYAAAIQLELELQVVAQASPEHVYGEHCVRFVGLQDPKPSQA